MFSDRLKEALVLRNMKQADLARKANVSTAIVSQWVNGFRNPSKTYIFSIARVLHVSALWLETGDGDMILPESVDDYDRFTEAMEGQSSGKKEIVRLALAMPDELAEQLLHFLEQQLHSD